MKKYLSTILTLLLLIFLISCGGGGGGGGSSSTQGKLSFVQIKLGGSEKPDVNSNDEAAGFRENSIPSNIYKFSFTISASDMTTVQKDVLVSGQTAVTETFSIQNGSGRYFLIEAKDSSGSVLYKGDSTKDLDGTPVTLNIVMIAQNTTGGTTTTITTDTTTTTTTTTTSTTTTTPTTTTTSDTTAPTITAVSPGSGATGVAINSTLTATFSEAMDSSTITTSTFTVSGGVTGTVTYSGTTATFTPSSNLSYSTTYTATITTGVKDSAGNAMASNYTWSWTTGAAPSAPTGVSASTGNGQVTISWTAVTGATSYNIYWSTTTGVTKTTGTQISSATSPYIHTGRTNGTTYYYIVTTVNSDGESSESSQVSAISSAIQLPKTGQTTSYSTDDDGTLQKGVAWPSTRFTVSDCGVPADSSDDVVTDNLTGLMWVRRPDSTARTWQPALDYANNLTLCGYTDWRLPNRKELRSLVNYGQSNSATWLNTQGFSNVQAGGYWSSTTLAYITGSAWSVYMNVGYVSDGNKAGGLFVLPVRAGQ